MAHGSAVPMQIYRLPDGVKYLVIEYDHARNASLLVAKLGPGAVHLAVEDDRVDVYIDNVFQTETHPAQPTDKEMKE